MNLMNTVGQFNRTADIYGLAVYTDFRVCRLNRKQNPADLILNDLNISYIQYRFFISLDHNILSAADAVIG